MRALSVRGTWYVLAHEGRRKLKRRHAVATRIHSEDSLIILQAPLVSESQDYLVISSSDIIVDIVDYLLRSLNWRGIRDYVV